MSPSVPITCTHERGPGTTLCLRCRHEQFQAAQRRRQQMLMRLLGIGSVVAIIGIAGAAGALTIGGHGNVTETSGGSIAVKQEGASRKSRGPRQLAPQPAPAAAATATPKTDSAPAPVVPAAPSAAEPPVVANTKAVADVAPKHTDTFSDLGQGRTPLTDSIFAMRSGDSVLVSFDTHGNRTRRADKFEAMVRSTLPLVYGKRVTAKLDSVPVGDLLPSHDVVGELRSRGLHLQLSGGTKIVVRPQVRETSDGPLVVSYWTIVER